MSKHEIEVFRVKEIETHPNADTLGIVKVHGWTCCVKLDQVKVGDLIAYVPPDFVLKTSRPEFAFLGKDGKETYRMRVCKFRGVMSQGLIVPIAEDSGLKEGDNALDYLEIIRYEPPDFTTGGKNINSPSGLYAPKYDVENYQRYFELFVDGEEVVATEKIHGANAKFIYSSVEKKMFCGSRTNWKAESELSAWWRTLNQNPCIEHWCRNYPDVLVYGEVFGSVQNLRYGANSGQFFFAAFDILDKDCWLNYDEAQKIGKGLTWAPLVYRGPFNREKLMALAEENSRWSTAKNQMSEGIVVKPTKERMDMEIGRVQLKIVSNRYLEKS